MTDMLTFDKLSPDVRATAIRSMVVQNFHFLDRELDSFKALPIDVRINLGMTLCAQIRKRAWTRRMLSDAVFAEKVILSNLMHFNAQGHCYSYTLKRFFS